MKYRVMSALALAVALAASSTAVSAQSTNTSGQLPEGFSSSSSERPAGYDDVASQERPAGYEDASADSAKPEGYDSQTSTGLTDDMQAMVDNITKQNQSLLTGGDEATACEVILCLSTGSPPHECAASLARYFGITDWRFWKMIEKRLNFLKLCPAANQSPQMSSLVEAMANGAGRCDAATLNQTLRTWTGIDGEYEISNQMPSYCSAYYGHEYASDMNASLPRYIDKYVTRTYVDSEGVTQYEYDGGYWVDGSTASAKVASDANGAIPASKDPAAIGSF
jgi:TrbM